MRVDAPMLGLILAACWIAGPLRASADCAVSPAVGNSSLSRFVGELPAVARSARHLFEFATPVGSACTVRGPGRPDLVFRASFEEGDCQALEGLACDGADTDLCFEGTIACVDGSPVCSDNTGSTTEVCNGLDDDCDGAADEDFVPNTNPACSAGTTFMGSVSGDADGGTLMAQGMTEQWLRFRLREDSNTARDLTARITLAMPAGVDYDLFVYCAACGGLLSGSSTQAGFGVQENVTITVDDPFLGGDDSVDLIVEVRHRAHSVCASWSLMVLGNVAPGAVNCN